MSEDTELLGRIPLFAGVTFFVVTRGEADVSVNGQSRRLSTGDYFGEMSIIDRSPRSAEVVAVTELECLVFTQWEFRLFLKDHPDVAWAVLESLVRRLRESKTPSCHKARASQHAKGTKNMVSVDGPKKNP
jgi:CRP-like cAMP-binding protein